MEEVKMIRASMRIISLVALLALVVLVAGDAAGQKDAPKMLIRNESVELGTFLEGVDIEYAFVVRNTGASELRILSVRPG